MKTYSIPALLFAVAFSTIISPAYALPLLSAGYGLNTLNAPFTASVADSIAVSVADGVVVTNPYYAKSVKVNGSSEPGRLRAENSVETYRPYAQNRSEVSVTFQGQIGLSGTHATFTPATARSRIR